MTQRSKDRDHVTRVRALQGSGGHGVSAGDGTSAARSASRAPSFQRRACRARRSSAWRAAAASRGSARARFRPCPRAVSAKRERERFRNRERASRDGVVRSAMCCERPRKVTGEAWSPRHAVCRPAVLRAAVILPQWIKMKGGIFKL